MNYARMYRFGITPWERYGTAAAGSIAALLDREETGRCSPFGRALDLGCGRGQYTRELARRGWQTVGIDCVPAAIDAAAAFGPGRWRRLIGGTSRDEIEAAFAGWEMLAVDPADTAGLGWPMNTTAPRWYRLRQPA
jgi:SAM-dependent methyltransferase